MIPQRRSLLKNFLTTITAFAGFKLTSNATELTAESGQAFEVMNYQNEPLFAGYTKLGNLVFVSGTGADDASVHDIRKDTDFVLKKMEKRLLDAGSSMEKVLKVTVFLNDLEDFQGMNEVYKGRFGKKPPARSTVAVAKGGIPGKSIIEIDCIAYI
jgi:2-iminobutanoate/2-iminopropanoate deaminase